MDPRQAVLSALAATVRLCTQSYVVAVAHDDGWQIADRGSKASAADSRWVSTAAAGYPRPAHGSWLLLGDPGAGLVLGVGDPDVARLVEPVLHLASTALQSVDVAASVAYAETEIVALRAVAGRILRAHTLDEALLCATNETRSLLQADIAGVLLRDGEEIFMRSCAGNQFAETSHLRMRRGQGLAGLVFATGGEAKTDDYLSDAVISDDFRDLARLEKTRSALAAPLIVDGEVIGVLEVWRRRASRFSAAESRRLVALADLAAIALDNARLHALSEANAREAAKAHRLVEAQLDRVERSLRVQQELVEALVAGVRLPAILRIVSERADCHVCLLSVDGDELASWPPDTSSTPSRKPSGS